MQVSSFSPSRWDQIAFVDAECRFGLGQLHVGTPEFLAAPIDDVAAQQITAFAQPSPIAPIVSLAPLQMSSAACLGLDVHAKYNPAARLLGPSSLLSQQ